MQGIKNTNKTLIFNILFLFPVFSMLLNMDLALAQETNSDLSERNKVFITELSEGFSHRISVLSYADTNGISDSTQNPDNDFLKLNDYSENFMVKPDFSLAYKDLYVSAKPRADLKFEQFNTGSQKGKRTRDHDIFISEYRIQYNIKEELFVSFGREFLQWGPSFLWSPSNPFFPDNGKTRPNQENEGKEFVQLLWINNINWAHSFIANIGNGRADGSDFENTYALKIDYSGDDGYASLIFSQGQGRNKKEKIGLYGGLTATDALIIYGEANFEKGSDTLYPIENNSLLNYSMVPVEQSGNSIYCSFLAGGTYTFESGSSLTFEYLYNQAGYNDTESENYYKLRNNAYKAYSLSCPVSGLARQSLGNTFDNGLMFLRQNYFMLQYIKNDIFDLMDFTLRWSQCIDDKSVQLFSNIDYYVGDNARLFVSGIYNPGNHETSFGSMLDYQAMIGMEYIF